MTGRVIFSMVCLGISVFSIGVSAGATIQQRLDRKSYDGLLDNLGYDVHHIGNQVVAMKKGFSKKGLGL